MKRDVVGVGSRSMCKPLPILLSALGSLSVEVLNSHVLHVHSEARTLVRLPIILKYDGYRDFCLNHGYREFCLNGECGALCLNDGAR
jgi:hypothetical protein